MFFKAFILCGVFCLASAVDSSISVSAFNVQVFGKSKMAKPEVVEALVEIIKRYDITIIQEIRDIHEEAFPDLVEKVNNADKTYHYASFMSPRAGRTSSKEQYGYIYRTERVQLCKHFDYPDKRHDIFERDPHIAQFRCLTGCKQSIFNIIVLHAKPDDAVAEISSLVEVYDYANSVTGVEDAVILGDLNSDCGYVTARDWPKVDLRTDPRFTWLIDDDADTTVSTTDCAYDRIITAGAVTYNARSPSVYNFEQDLGLSCDEAGDISDHFPVEFYID